MEKKYNFDEFQMAYDHLVHWINIIDISTHCKELIIEAIDHLVEVLKDAK